MGTFLEPLRHAYVLAFIRIHVRTRMYACMRDNIHAFFWAESAHDISIYVYIYICICLSIYSFVYLLIHKSIYIYTERARERFPLCIYMHTLPYIDAYIDTCIHTCMSTYIENTCVHIWRGRDKEREREREREREKEKEKEKEKVMEKEKEATRQAESPTHSTRAHTHTHKFTPMHVWAYICTRVACIHMRCAKYFC